MSEHSAFLSPFLSLPLLLAESSDHSVCLPSQVTVFLLRQAGTVPGLSLRFVNFCLVHLETNRREYTQV